MAPKRKRATEADSAEPTGTTTRSTRATRSSKDNSNAMQVDPIPPKKKTKSSAGGSKGAGRSRKKDAGIDEAHGGVTAGERDEDPTPPVPKMTPTPSLLKPEPYTPQRALYLFKNYADSDNPNVIGPEGFERLCAEAEIPMEGAMPLLLAWQMNASEMAKLTKEEWVKGTDIFKLSSLSALATALADLESLLIRNQKPLERSNKKDPYDRTQYWKYADDTKGAFHKFYTFCYNLVKPPQSRNIDMETSMAFWSVLLVPKYPIMTEVLEFINEKGSYKATNKDLWTMMLEFCTTVQPSLTDYESDGAWPTLLDDFVTWKRDKSSNGRPGNAMEH